MSDLAPEEPRPASAAELGEFAVGYVRFASLCAGRHCSGSSDVCCESSARDAATSGLRVLMVADANAARRDLDHNSALHTVHRSFGDVRTTAEVLTPIGHGDAPEQGAAARVRPPRVRPAPGVAFAVPPPVPRATVRTPVLSRSR